MQNRSLEKRQPSHRRQAKDTFVPNTTKTQMLANPAATRSSFTFLIYSPDYTARQFLSRLLEIMKTPECSCSQCCHKPPSPPGHKISMYSLPNHRGAGSCLVSLVCIHGDLPTPKNSGYQEKLDKGSRDADRLAWRSITFAGVGKKRPNPNCRGFPPWDSERKVLSAAV